MYFCILLHSCPQIAHAHKRGNNCHTHTVLILFGWDVWKDSLTEDLAGCELFSGSRGSKSRRRHWGMSRHVPGSAISDRWDKSPRQAWMETGWKDTHTNTHTHTHTPPPADSCPSERKTYSEVCQMSVSLLGIFTASLTCFDSDMIRPQLNGSWGVLLFRASVCVCMLSFKHQQMLFLYEWRISFGDYVSSRWMNNSVCDLKMTVHYVDCQVCTLRNSHQTA